MAEIYLTALTSYGGPDLPSELGCIIRQREWLGGGTVPELRLFIGRDTVIIWPADPDRIGQLAKKLTKIADDLTRKENR